VTERSREPITGADLARLGELALRDLASLVERETATGRRYRDRLLCIALCQGAAQHYVDGENGVKDFDVWSFFSAHPAGPFPYRRRVERDFGRSKFSRHPADPRRFLGRASIDVSGPRRSDTAGWTSWSTTRRSTTTRGSAGSTPTGPSSIRRSRRTCSAPGGAACAPFP
jgi:hypothetical protein